MNFGETRTVLLMRHDGIPIYVSDEYYQFMKTKRLRKLRKYYAYAVRITSWKAVKQGDLL